MNPSMSSPQTPMSAKLITEVYIIYIPWSVIREAELSTTYNLSPGHMNEQSLVGAFIVNGDAGTKIYIIIHAYTSPT